VASSFEADTQSDLGEPAWAAAAEVIDEPLIDSVIVACQFDPPYRPGLPALRAGRLLSQAIEHLESRPNVLMTCAS
jgi:deoxyinosine 3'endonuclease (endonuclease V)